MLTAPLVCTRQLRRLAPHAGICLFWFLELEHECTIAVTADSVVHHLATYQVDMAA
jgi:hypothetical protein